MQWNLIPGSVLTVGQSLSVGDYLQSPGKTCFLVMQSDGNLCVYAGVDPSHNRGYVWSCRTTSLPQGAYFTIMQSDGNLCVYHGTPSQPGPWVWSWTTTPPPHAQSYFAQLDDHGDLTVHTGTPSAPITTLWGNFGVTPGSRIEHVVVLMLENRGFDTALGFLYTPHDPPAVNVPPLRPGELPFAGLAYQPGKPQTANVDGTIVTRTASRGVAGANSPGFDPGEEFDHVTTQLFGSASLPKPGTPPTMDGFLADFWSVLSSETHPLTNKLQVLETLMNMYAPWDLPNLSRVARTYGVSDAWFSSVPTQTNANRAFSLCGQSAGEVNNGYIGGSWSSLGVDTFTGMNTIFNALSAAGMTDWAIYYNELYPPAAVTNACYTELAFPQIDQAAHAGTRFRTLSTFLDQARTGTLPRFSYIEPRWGGAVLDQQIYVDGNDYHPPVDITHSEQMLEQLCQALTANRTAWNKTLVVIMFDEHGGTYDHVPPPWGATPPWGNASPPPTQESFGFDRYGVRVPNLFLSPYIAGSTVVRSPTATPFDHTSMLAGVLDWCGIDRAHANLGARTVAAPSFWNVLNLPLPRTDDNPFAVVAAPPSATPVHWGQRFFLQSALGAFVTSQTWFNIPGYAAWYPTYGWLGRVALELRAAAIGNGYQAGTEIAAGGPYQVRTSEANQYSSTNNPEWYNSLYVNKGRIGSAVWYGCTDVTADLTQGGWLVHAVSPSSGTLTYGGTVRLESVLYPGHYLYPASGYLYLTTKADATSLWTLLPAPSGG